MGRLPRGEYVCAQFAVRTTTVSLALCVPHLSQQQTWSCGARVLTHLVLAPQYMFYEAKNFNQNISAWDVSRVENMKVRDLPSVPPQSPSHFASPPEPAADLELWGTCSDLSGPCLAENVQ